MNEHTQMLNVAETDINVLYQHTFFNFASMSYESEDLFHPLMEICNNEPVARMFEQVLKENNAKWNQFSNRAEIKMYDITVAIKFLPSTRGMIRVVGPDDMQEYTLRGNVSFSQKVGWCQLPFYKEFNGSCSELNEHLKNAAAAVVQQRKKNLKYKLKEEARNGLG
jgi:hypothetical protein